MASKDENELRVAQAKAKLRLLSERPATSRGMLLDLLVTGTKRHPREVVLSTFAVGALIGLSSTIRREVISKLFKFVKF